jgi:hypothetical protein
LCSNTLRKAIFLTSQQKNLGATWNTGKCPRYGLLWALEISKKTWYTGSTVGRAVPVVRQRIELENVNKRLETLRQTTFPTRQPGGKFGNA